VVEALNRDGSSPQAYVATKQLITNCVIQLKTLLDIPMEVNLDNDDPALKDISRKANQAAALGSVLQLVTNSGVLFEVMEPRLPELNTDHLQYAYKVAVNVLAKASFQDARNTKDAGDSKLKEGNSVEAKKCYSKAVERYSKAIQFGFTNRNVFHNRGFAYLSLNQDPSAEADFRTAANAATDPKKKADSLENVGLVYLRRQDWQAALDNSDIVNSLDDRMTWNLLFRLVAADKLGKTDIAAACRDLLKKSETDLDEPSLTQYLPPELHFYVGQAVGIRKNAE
jgi:tetratricopeptide (TPR) repeat protein